MTHSESTSTYGRSTMLKFCIVLAVVTVCYAQSAEKIYFLYTNGNRQPENVTIANINLPVTFNPEHNTIVLIHGHGGSASASFNTRIIQETLNFRPDHNIFVVDWKEEASESYSVASSYVKSVADDLASFIRWLTSHTRIEPISGANTAIVDVKTLHLVGFGLGAHVAGIASRQLRWSPGLVGRITGLDPSGSGWGSRSSRLTDEDADYVEVIHTDGSGLLANGIGTPIGQVNFYANGGSNQPGCFSHSCSHNRAWELFAASMRGRLVGYACSSKTQMNLNLCRGRQLNLGGTDMEKTRYNNIYRINTGRSFPF